MNKLLKAIYKQSQIDCLIAILEQNLSIPLLCTGRLFLHEMTVLTFTIANSVKVIFLGTCSMRGNTALY